MEGGFTFSHLLQDGKKSVHIGQLFSENGLLHHDSLSYPPKTHDKQQSRQWITLRNRKLHCIKKRSIHKRSKTNNAPISIHLCSLELKRSNRRTKRRIRIPKIHQRSKVELLFRINSNHGFNGSNQLHFRPLVAKADQSRATFCWGFQCQER